MFRRLLSAVAVLACLSLLTAGAVEARPLAAHPGPCGFFQELWQWMSTGGPAIPEKEGPGMDPNGIKHHRTPPPVPARGHKARPNG
jgi:hypothetical protein